MTRIDALREVGQFVRTYRSAFASLPRDAEGKPVIVEIRKLLAIDPEIAVALAAVLATVYCSVEHEAGILAGKAFDGRAS